MTEQNQIREYLLGTLDPESSHDLEERLFHDDGFYASVRDERDALIDDFLTGSLTGDEDELFRRQCRLSPDLRESVQASRTLQAALERSRASISPARVLPQRTSLLQRSRPWHLFGLPLLAGAVCALLLTVGIMRHRSASSMRVGVPQPVPAYPAPGLATVQAEPETFFLAAAVTRGAGSRPIIRVPRETPAIRLEVEVRHDLENVPSWRTEMIGKGQTVPLPGCERAHRVGERVFLVCTLSLGGLPSGIYTIRMTPGVTGALSVDRIFLLVRER